METLLSSESLADFLNQADNISKISEYDRNMLKQYEATQENIQVQEEKVEEESDSINSLLSEKAPSSRKCSLWLQLPVTASTPISARSAQARKRQMF